MDRGALFLASLKELEGKLSSRDEYELLAISRLLRLLLNDGEPLIQQVNRQHRVSIVFECVRPVLSDWPPELPRPALALMPDGLDPESAPPERSESR